MIPFSRVVKITASKLDIPYKTCYDLIYKYFKTTLQEAQQKEFIDPYMGVFRLNKKGRKEFKKKFSKAIQAKTLSSLFNLYVRRLRNEQ